MYGCMATLSAAPGLRAIIVIVRILDNRGAPMSLRLELMSLRLVLVNQRLDTMKLTLDLMHPRLVL